MIADLLIQLTKDSTSLHGISKDEMALFEEKLICIIGPSGVGKTSLCESITRLRPNFIFWEAQLRDQGARLKSLQNNYRLISEDEFTHLIREEEFLHWEKN